MDGLWALNGEYEQPQRRRAMRSTIRSGRIAALIAFAALLTGCNMVTSPKPLFFAADAVGQPQLRPGVWVSKGPACVIDEQTPREAWPDCADSWIVRPGEVINSKNKDRPQGAGDHFPIVLAKGDPAVLQIGLTDDAGLFAAYVYMGLRVLKRDAEGRVIAYKLWPALCGPPPKADPNATGDLQLTARPIAGLVLDTKNHDCIASAQAPVHRSVSLSEAWNDEDSAASGHDEARWVRDDER
jgi:hypothetical protein